MERHSISNLTEDILSIKKIYIIRIIFLRIIRCRDNIHRYNVPILPLEYEI